KLLLRLTGLESVRLPAPETATTYDDARTSSVTRGPTRIARKAATMSRTFIRSPSKIVGLVKRKTARQRLDNPLEISCALTRPKCSIRTCDVHGDWSHEIVEFFCHSATLCFPRIWQP